MSEPRRSVRAEAKAIEAASASKEQEAEEQRQAKTKPKPAASKDKAAGAKGDAAGPPESWEFPKEGDAIEVEVEGDGGVTNWEKAQVVELAPWNGSFKARIKTKDDSWDDWFTWREEGTDWRRKSSRRRSGGEGRSAGPKFGKLRLRIDHLKKEATLLNAGGQTARQRAYGARPLRGQKQMRFDVPEGTLPFLSVDDSLVGQKVRVLTWYASDLTWSKGSVTAFNANSRRHTVRPRAPRSQPHRLLSLTRLGRRGGAGQVRAHEPQAAGARGGGYAA